jgi:hypothetical protein
VSSTTKREPVDALAVFLAGQPTAVARLLAEHVDDGRGDCRACSLPQGGYVPWPCTLAAVSGDHGHTRGTEP